MTAGSDPLADAPDDLRAFLRDAAALRDARLRIHPLTSEESRTYSSALQEIPVGKMLGLIALDDANDSNPYCLITRGLAAGMVMRFSHDAEPEIHFASLADFKRSLTQARERRLTIDDLPREPLAPHANQGALEATLSGDPDSDEAEFMINLLLPLLSPAGVAVLERLSASGSFFVREAVARFIAAHPGTALAGIAQQLAADGHGQVAEAGAAALRAIGVAGGRGQSF